ncbi:MAG: HDIG domain-containing protein [Methanomassiliicoccus sp.]|nr:HDIG domain-containing protein [Methanomassiliicoccus sp.]
MLSRADALDLVRMHVRKENNVKHMISVGAIMREMASRAGEDADRWELAGILHDIDLEICSGMEDHTLKARELLGGRADEELVEVIMAHNHEATGVAVDSRFKVALIVADAASGLVTACALVMPSRKLADVQAGSVIKKFGNKDFAKGVSRDRIMRCEELGMSRDEFLTLALDGMRKAAGQLGL